MTDARTKAIDALRPFAALRADDGDTFTSYPREMIVRCEVTVGEILAAREALAALEAEAALATERERALEEALRVAVWSEEERDGMADAYRKAERRGRGHYETLFAVGAWLLRYRFARSIKAKEPPHAG